MYLEIFLADFAVFRVFLGISRDFAEIPEFRRSATARNIRSPEKSQKNIKNADLISTKPIDSQRNLQQNQPFFTDCFLVKFPQKLQRNSCRIGRFSANLSLKIPRNLTFSSATYQKPRLLYLFLRILHKEIHFLL